MGSGSREEREGWEGDTGRERDDGAGGKDRK